MIRFLYFQIYVSSFDNKEIVMKFNNIIFSSLFILILFSCGSKSSHELILGTWQMEDMDMSMFENQLSESEKEVFNSPLLTESIKAITMEFRANGVYIVKTSIMDQYAIDSANWFFSEDNTAITIGVGSQMKNVKIIEVTEKHLILQSLVPNNEVRMTLLRKAD
jgi:hypothetical protein